MVASSPTFRVIDGTLRIEHLRETLGVGVSRPRLSWQIASDTPDWLQSAYEIEARDPSAEILWSSGRVETRDSVLVPWPGPPLMSRQRASVRVRVWAAGEAASGWSAPLAIEAGLLEPSDWSARFVIPDWDEDTAVLQPSPLLRREFTLRGDVARARLYISALGLYEAEINGERVGDHVLAPGWTSYDHRLRYQVFDALPLLREGANAIGAILADGWYRGQLGFPGSGGRNLYGDRLALLAQLEIDYADGSRETIATGPEWKAARGPVTSAGIYEGESYDARLDPRGWSQPGFDEGEWSGVRIGEADLATLVAPPGPPVRRIEEIAPVAITRSPSGRTIVDFGQNATGRLRITVDGLAGTTVTMRHAEILQAGELCTEPLRGATATDTYTLRGNGPETYEPRFTFHGFRFAEITGWPGQLALDDVRFVVTHSDMERTGWFECSDPLLNRLHENIVWSMRSNFLDVPTDCPQRDERLGWTGDLTVFAPTGTFLYDAAGFITSWLADLAADQKDDGTVPMVIPDVIGRAPGARVAATALATAVWSDAAVIVPWTIFERFGDAGILREQYESMRRWVRRAEELAGPERLWDRGFQFGDWLDPMAPPDDSRRAMTDPGLVATAYFWRVSSLLAQAASVLGREDDSRNYAQLAQEVQEAFRREFITPSGRTASDTQTGLALAIRFGFLDPQEQAHAGQRLAYLARTNGHRVGTGFVGTALVLDALCDTGHEDVAFRMLTEQSCPSWLYPVTRGATTIWERWDSLKPDGTINSSTMTSFNHYALGAVGDWLHRVVGGLAPLEPGYRRIEVRPRIGGGLTHASSRLRTPYGLAESKWRLEGRILHLDVTIPPNTTALITPLPESAPVEVGSGEHHWQVDAGTTPR